MTSVTEIQQQIKTFFTVRARTLAKETFAIRRERKFNGSTLLQTLLFGWQQHPHSSLDQLASTAKIAHVQVSDTAIDKHFVPETVTFLQACLQELTHIVVQSPSPLTLPLLARFPEIVYEDSSIISLPDELHELYAGTGAANGAVGPLSSCMSVLICAVDNSLAQWSPRGFTAIAVAPFVISPWQKAA